MSALLSSTISVLLLLVIAASVSSDKELSPKSTFSGLYRPDISKNMELFSSAWLISKEKFIRSRRAFAGISNFEGTVFSVVGRGALSRRNALMTRDFFDFQVEHLSSTLNILEDSELIKLLDARLSRRTEALQELVATFNRTTTSATATHKYGHKTVAIVPFSSTGAHATRGGTATEKDAEQRLRTLMFCATFWSLYRYQFQVVVSVSSSEDRETLLGLRLPVFRIYSLMDLPRKSEQPKRSLLRAGNDIKSDENWRHFQFVYYTDGDQILHARNLHVLYETLLLDPRNLVLCPHRWHTLPLPKDLPPRHRGSKHFSIADLAQHTNLSTLIVESGLNPQGSCCDDGRYFITNTSTCNNFWYFCDELHALTLMEWVKFGPHGFPAPLTSEHLGKCRYYPNRRRCDVPKDCSGGKGKQIGAEASDGSVICEEIAKSYSF